MGPTRGYGLTGLLGGVVSSTAVTLQFSRLSRMDGKASTALSVGVVAACTVVPVRVALICGALNPGLAQVLLPYLDIGTDVYEEFGHLAEAVTALKERGYQVSIDSLRPRDILTAVNAGADMVLSFNSSNLALAADLDCPLVLIPDEDRDLRTLLANAERLLAWNKQVVIILSCRRSSWDLPRGYSATPK